MAEKSIALNKMDHISSIFGDFDENINTLQKEYGVVIFSRGTDIKIT